MWLFSLNGGIMVFEIPPPILACHAQDFLCYVKTDNSSCIVPASDVGEHGL